jgi:2-keto-4-pentenoate hydratase/2-oxohepta-3-ene-1,7-dioic acid hydratase in catechol pathway
MPAECPSGVSVKGFDKYAPLGPMMASPKLVGDAGNLRIQTFVNGESRQYSRTNDLLFSVKEDYQFHQSGHSFGTGHCHNDLARLSGVASGMKPKPVWLKDGDIVEVKIEHLGSTKNRMAFE